MVAPVGAQITLTCRVHMAFRVVWIVEIPGIGRFEAESPAAITALQNEGFITVPSSAQDREIPLNITGSLSNNQATVNCMAVNNNIMSERYVERDQANITIEIYGKPSTIIISFNNGQQGIIWHQV